MIAGLIGMGLNILGAEQEGEAIKDSARFNAAQAEEDIKLLKVGENQAIRDARFQGSSDLAAIEAASAVSGVKVGEGSALDAIRFQAEQNAREEFKIRLETKVATQNRRAGAALEIAQANNRAQGIRLGAAGQALSSGTALAMAGR